MIFVTIIFILQYSRVKKRKEAPIASDASALRAGKARQGEARQTS
jgi:hypothetical protein